MKRKTEYMQKTDHFTIVVHPMDFERWMSELRTNKTLAPEITGFLLGKAQPVVKFVRCKICKEKINEGEGYEHSNFEEYCHKTCWDVAKEKARNL